MKKIFAILITSLLITSLLAGTLISVHANEIVIDPQPGQYANYSHVKYHPDGTVVWSGWWNTSYLHYVESDVINTTNTIVRPEYVNGTFWFTINKTTRFITDGNHWYVPSYYIEWIETDIDMGSTVNIWDTTGEIIDAVELKINLNGGEVFVDCWVVNWTAPFFFMSYFDKQTGLLIADLYDWGDSTILGNDTLVSTNIPIGATPIRIEANVEMDPDTLNLDSRGEWITSYFELPEGYYLDDINVSTILLNETIPAAPHPTLVGDYDSDGVLDLMVKFNRAEVVTYISTNVNMTKLANDRYMMITLIVTCELNDGTPFEGSDTVTILYMPRNVGYGKILMGE